MVEERSQRIGEAFNSRRKVIEFVNWSGTKSAPLLAALSASSTVRLKLVSPTRVNWISARVLVRVPPRRDRWRNIHWVGSVTVTAGPRGSSRPSSAMRRKNRPCLIEPERVVGAAGV